MEPKISFSQYQTEGFFDELLDEKGKPRPGMESLCQALEKVPWSELQQKQHTAERALMSMGITFNVYAQGEGIERIMPIDIIPRVIAGQEWDYLERGLCQRVEALNLFIHDLYHDQNAIRDGIIPREVIASSKGFLPQCRGLKPPRNIWCHITGTDLIRGDDGQFMVLEDNLRCPSGVSYMLENRELLKKTFPEILEQVGVRHVSDYAARLRDMLESISSKANPTIVVLTPGIYNSAYFEHSYLAQQMGVQLVESTDLVVINDVVKMRTTKGFETVDVIYRRIDDTFLDPLAFRSDSLIGIPGIFQAYQKGKVALANAPGTGVADDKVVYAYVPRLIKYYLQQEAILPNVETYLCWEEESRKYVLDNIESLVVKEANEAGGYGMLIGPKSTQVECQEFRQRIKDNPRNYIAQPTISLSRVPTIVGDQLEGRHVDLRPYILYGDSIQVMPGGLTRVALRKGSLVVNSSQGGGSKDTWVLY